MEVNHVFSVFVSIEHVAYYFWSAWTSSTGCHTGCISAISIASYSSVALNYWRILMIWGMFSLGASGHLLGLWYRTASTCLFDLNSCLFLCFVLLELMLKCLFLFQSRLLVFVQIVVSIWENIFVKCANSMMMM